MRNSQTIIGMKKQISKIFIFILAILSFSTALRAEDILVLEFNSGEKITWKTSELPVVTTQEDNVLITTKKEQSVAYPISHVLKFYIGDDNSTNVSSQNVYKQTITVADGRIEIMGLLPNEQCKVFKLNGTLEKQTKADSNGTVRIEGLFSGIHIIKSKSESIKVILP